VPGTLNGEETPVNLFRRMNREAEPSLRITSGCAPLVLSMTGTLLPATGHSLSTTGSTLLPATGHSLPILDLCLLVAVGLVLKVTCNKCTTPKLSELPYSTKIPAILVVERREWREISSDMGKKSGFFLMSGAFDTEGLDKVLLMSQQP
jgi:hypothetical protein